MSISLIHLDEYAPGKWSSVHPTGFPDGYTKPTTQDLFTQLEDVLATLGPENMKNMFFACAHHRGGNSKTPPRSKATFDYQTILPFDLDHIDTLQPLLYVDIVSRILQVDTKNLTYWITGNGLQIFVHLKEPVRSIKYMEELKPAYLELVRKITAAISGDNLPGYADPVIWEPARILRLPNTLNVKNGVTKQSLLINRSNTEVDLDIKEISGLGALERENVSSAQVRRDYPRPDFNEMVKECQYIQHYLLHPGGVHEPQAFDLFSLLSNIHPGDGALWNNKEWKAEELARHIFDAATESESLAKSSFESKWEGASKYGVRKCTTLAESWEEGCRNCPHRGKIPTPLALKSPDFVSSTEMGYWHRNSKGVCVHPEYDDLCKVFYKENSYVIRKGERPFIFDGKKYAECEHLVLKGWIDKKVNPTSPLRDVHCNEFVNTLKRKKVLSEPQEEALFETGIHGKLNCANGVLDILTGQLLEHSPLYGFQYVLPYEYKAGEASELFLDWLGDITCSRTELMETLLDLMAYCLWPTYDDHMFAYLVGDGSNGKSTLLHVIKALVGDDNCSFIGIHQLTKNRFSPAQLEGKLVNLSEESSGHRMTYEEGNIINNLSAGGNIEAERKNKQGYPFANRAKLIFSANKTPIIEDKGVAVKRRLLAIPFDYTITAPDPNIERRLIAEAPKIMSMLIDRIQTNIKEHNGLFKISRGGRTTAEAQEKMLLKGESVKDWADENIESSAAFTLDDPSDCVPIKEAYDNYFHWCGQYRVIPVSKFNFSHLMYKLVIAHNVDKDDNRVYVGKDRKRVFKRTRWRKDI